MLKVRVRSCFWALLVGLTFGCSAAQTDSGDLQVSNSEAVNNNVVGGGEYGTGNDQVANGQLIGVGGNVGNVNNVMNDSNLNLNTANDTVSGSDVTDAVESAQAIDTVSSSDDGDALANGANVANIEQPQSDNLYGDDQTQTYNNLNNQIDSQPMDDSMSAGAGAVASDTGMSDTGMGSGAGGAETTMTASLPEMGAKMVYIVKRGDTLGDIAQNIYGDKSKWRDLASWSGFANPHLIFPGDVVYYQYTQESASFAANYEAQQRMEEVVVQTGDSLSKIAARVYGNPMAWVVLWRHNGHVADPDVIQVGMQIHYPVVSFLVADAQDTAPAQGTAPVLDAAVDQVDQADDQQGQVASQVPDQVPAAG